MKAVGEVLKYSYQLKFEQLKTLNEIIKYFHVHHQGVYIDELITYQTISKRQLRHHLEHLYHLDGSLNCVMIMIKDVYYFSHPIAVKIN